LAGRSVDRRRREHQSGSIGDDLLCPSHLGSVHDGLRAGKRANGDCRASDLFRGHGIGCANLYAIAQTLAGPRASGKWVGVQNAIGNLAGIVAPVLTGALIDWTGRYSVGFLVAGAIAMSGAGAWLLLVRRVAPIAWSATGQNNAIAEARL